MSVAVSTRVWKHSRLRGSARTLLLAIADRADEDGYAWPGIGYLAERVGVCERQTQRLVRQAQALGEIYVALGGGRKKSSRYLVALGLGLGQIAESLVAKFQMEVHAATRTAGDLLERQKGDIRAILSRKRVTSASPLPATITPETVTSPSPLPDERVTSAPPDPSWYSDPESSEDSDQEKTPSESVPRPGRPAITGERLLHSPYRPTPGMNAPSPGSERPPSPAIAPEGLIAMYRYRLAHYARPGELKTICGQPIDRFENLPSGPGSLQICRSCQRSVEGAPMQPHIAIIYAWWEAIPETIRPPGKPPIDPNARDACAVRDAGISPDQVREYVTATSPGYVRWARKKSVETKEDVSPVMSLYYVRMHIKGYLASKGERDEQNRDKAADSGPPRPRVSGIKF